MDTRRWIGWLAVVAFGATVLAARGTDPTVGIIGGTPEQRAMADWAVGRFEAGNLTLPSLEVRFHRDRSGCHDRLGYYEDGIASVCAVHVNQMSRRMMLHEMAHAWVEANVSAGLRERFLRLRQLETWNDQEVAWDERGTEHAADIISWALHDQGTGILLPSIPRNSVDELAVGFALLTGRPLPAADPVDESQDVTAS